MIVIKEMNMPKNRCNCWLNYILSLQRGTSKTYCTMELLKRMKDKNCQDYYISPVYDADGEITMYEVYSETCTKCIDKWRVVKEL